MTKIFRFFYEACVGTCYTGGDDFYCELKKSEEVEKLVNKIVAAHDSTCDDPMQRFGVDFDKNSGIYVGSFINNMKLDMFADKSFLVVAEKLADHVLSENKDKNITSGSCNFGLNGQENLAELILKAVQVA